MRRSTRSVPHTRTALKPGMKSAISPAPSWKWPTASNNAWPCPSTCREPLSKCWNKTVRQISRANASGFRSSFSTWGGLPRSPQNRDPALVIERLNQVLALEADVVRRHGGDVDKFVGDAMFAWSSGPARCRHAIDAAVEILSGLHERFAGKPGTEIGFGIHVGAVVVGSMGRQD